MSVLGFASADYATIDMALVQLGAVSVPLQTSAPVSQLRPIAAETEPRVLASSIDDLGDAVELMLTGHTPARLVVFDYRPEVDEQREAFDAASARLAEAGSPVLVETLAELLERGESLPAAPAFLPDDDDDPLRLLIYTSGSTGAQGCDVPGTIGREFLAQVALELGRVDRRTVDHAQLHADEPRDGSRHPLQHWYTAAPPISRPGATFRRCSRTSPWCAPPN